MDAPNENAFPLSSADLFLEILNNRGKQEPSSSLPRRTRGFVVLVRGATSLKPLQEACFTQTYNHCLTARYRLQSDAGLGTLWLAFLRDLELLRDGSKDFKGDLRSVNSTGDWRYFTESYLKRAYEPLRIDSLRSLTAGALDSETLARLLMALEDDGAVLDPGQRLVLFGELSEEATNLDEWQSALNGFFSRLPERVGLVLSGAPEKFRPPGNDPHYLELVLPKTSAAAPETTAETVARYAQSSLQSDLPAQKDQLDVEPFAEAIARFILHPQTRAPLTFGIYGEWGKGKSSFMKLIDLALIKYADGNVGQVGHETARVSRAQRLKDLQTTISQLESQVLGSKGDGKGPVDTVVNEYKTAAESYRVLWQDMQKEAKQNVISVTFNAWQFEDSKQIWAGLASQISKRIEEELPWFAQQRLRLKYAWKERRTELLLNVMLPVAIMFVVVGLFSVGYFRNIVVPPGLDSLGGLLRLLLPAGSALLTIWFLSSQILKVAKPMSERVLSYVSLPNYRDQMGFQHRVKDDLAFIFNFLKSRRPNCKVIVYIDDLDRCSESKIMEILQAINLILAGSEFFVFVGMNMEIIERAIATYYKDKAVDDLAEYYLSKIVQISFELPKNPDLDHYLYSLFSHQSRFELGSRMKSESTVSAEQKPEVAKTPSGGISYDLEKVLQIVSPTTQEVEDTPDELKAFCDYSDYLENNPRKVLRLINTHRLIKILLQRDNTLWPVERQRRLVIWRIFCDRWPYLVHYAIASPQTDNSLLFAIQRFEEIERDKLEDSSIKYEIGIAKTFVGMMKEEDRLSSRDIDEDFRRAADLMERVH
jgi:hypothetical protein